MQLPCDGTLAIDDDGQVTLTLDVGGIEGGLDPFTVNLGHAYTAADACPPALHGELADLSWGHFKRQADSRAELALAHAEYESSRGV